ncbi:MAG: glycosyltransferase family 2 protein [Rubellimicrobium sp.]|nr:glycosyltransferase family 2 protein [Rubellimicrobium sp.]
MTARVLTVILNWRTAEMTLRALDAAVLAMEGIAGGITVVDNDSGDGSFERIAAGVAARGLSRVRVLQSGRNGGFGAGNNHAIRAGLPEGRPDFVYILNSDAFPAPGAIRALLDHLLAHPEAGFAGSRIHGPDGEAHLTTFRFPSPAGEFEGAARIGPISRLLRGRAVPLPVPQANARVDWLAGASLMMRMDSLDRIGLFDEGFFLYYEETDLCLRLARAGQEVHFVHDSDVMHLGSVSTGMKTWARVPGYWFDSRWRYFTKNHGRAGAIAATAAQVAGGMLHRLRHLVTGGKRGDPPQFLRTLVAHDLHALLHPGRAGAKGDAHPAG